MYNRMFVCILISSIFLILLLVFKNVYVSNNNVSSFEQ